MFFHSKPSSYLGAPILGNLYIWQLITQALKAPLPSDLKLVAIGCISHRPCRVSVAQSEGIRPSNQLGLVENGHPQKNQTKSSQKHNSTNIYRNLSQNMVLLLWVYTPFFWRGGMLLDYSLSNIANLPQIIHLKDDKHVNVSKICHTLW